MFCESCGKTLPDGAKFCNGCGAKTAPAQPVLQEAEQPAVNTAPLPVYTPPAQTPPRQTYAPPPVYAPQQTYMPPAPYSPQPVNKPLGVGQYIGMFLLMCIPLVGIILLFMWAFGGTVNPNKKNFARAVLILSVIGLILSIVFGVVLAGIISELISNMGGYY